MQNKYKKFQIIPREMHDEARGRVINVLAILRYILFLSKR